MSTDLHTLSGAFAMDALSPQEAAQFQTHLEQCQACQDEVRELQEATATLGASEAQAPPAALKARVMAAADQQPQLPPKVTSIATARSSRRWTSRTVAAAAAMVLAVTGGFVVNDMLQDDGRQSVMASTVAQVFDAPDASTATVETGKGELAVATSKSLGRMAVDTHGLQPLGSKQVYQMWAIQDGTPTSAGLVDDIKAGKAMAMPSEGTTVAITIEPAGGSRLPTTEPIIEVDPESV